ncbi:MULTISPECIES: hypothetical protein [Pseudomonas]|jgi:hypothetical protein|uniref:hypothetical protein n=1 Tax=Pseudomonas TaxID=286 RepID=UPI00069DDBE5|nr:MULTISPECIES: hypothetical protein [Pseudomonas]MDK1399111.1 hypothetical protein [Pseudomonas protegens]MDT9643320.1 hypothetical protein [Pseudomonas sp. JV245A]NAN53573.1 hypothetical protein [Pseudomonas protegens]NUE78038.1 hypothetical protein [Pseudomonas protegens]QEN47897.1 hypothetical protein CLA18_15745 [Pseudomonas protegens]
MKFTSAGQIIDPRTVGYRSLGFGEALTIPATPYELRIHHGDLPQRFLDCADTFAAECKTDDIDQGFVDIPELAELGYPSFRTLLKDHPDLAARLVQDYLYFELLFSLFPHSSGLKVVINSITRVCSKEGVILLTGQTYAARHS